MGPGGLWWSNVLNSALPPQRLRPGTRPEHEDHFNYTVIILSSGGPTEGQGDCLSKLKSSWRRSGRGHNGSSLGILCNRIYKLKSYFRSQCGYSVGSISFDSSLNRSY